MLSRQEAEALGIQLDPVEQPEGVTDQPEETPMAEGENADPADAIPAEFQPNPPQEEEEDLQSQLEREFQPELESGMVEGEEEKPPEEPEEVDPLQSVHSVQIPEEQEEQEVKEVPKEEEEEEEVSVSLDSVSGASGGVASGQETANDVLSNIIQSLFNPHEPNQSNVAIVPRMVGGKRKLCLRLPASTASALLAQTGSPLAGSFNLDGAGSIIGGVGGGGGIPKKIKIVIPPNSMSSTASSLMSGLAHSFQQQTAGIRTVHSGKTSSSSSAVVTTTTGPARLDPDMLPSNSSGSSILLPSSPPPALPAASAGMNNKSSSSSKPFLASLFNTSAPTTTTTVKQTIQHPARKPVLGSTENPIQLVQEGNSFRSLQPLTPDQLKHIASVLKQNRQAILSGTGDTPSSGGGSAKSDPVGGGNADGKRRVVYDAASNTRIVYRVVTPGELKKPTLPAAAYPAASAIPPARGRGRGRGRPPRHLQARKAAAVTTTTPEVSESDDMSDADPAGTHLNASADMSKVI